MIRAFTLAFAGAFTATAAPTLAQPKIMPPGGESRIERCETLLQSGDFANRYEMIGGTTRSTACLMRGFIGQQAFDQGVGPRLQRYINLCYSVDEQAYLRNVVRRGVVQVMPYISQDGCDETLARVMRIELPDPAAGEAPTSVDTR